MDKGSERVNALFAPVVMSFINVLVLCKEHHNQPITTKYSFPHLQDNSCLVSGGMNT